MRLLFGRLAVSILRSVRFMQAYITHVTVWGLRYGARDNINFKNIVLVSNFNEIGVREEVLV